MLIGLVLWWFFTIPLQCGLDHRLLGDISFYNHTIEWHVTFMKIINGGDMHMRKSPAG
jgi:hypothetical protein